MTRKHLFRFVTSCLRVLVCAGGAIAVAAQQRQPTPQRAPGTITEGVTAVLVDVVVRDRRGQPVRDLTAADFEVLEDGVPQPLGSFTPMFSSSAPTAAPAAAPAATPAAAAPPAPAADAPIVTALVFDRLAPQSRKIAVQAAQSYLGTKEQTSGHIAIFGIDLALYPYATFTRNTAVLRQALTKVASGVSPSFGGAERREQRASAEREAGAAAAAADAAIAAGGPGTSAAVGSSISGALLAQMAVNIERGFEAMERDQQGYASTNGLLAIINALRPLKGRKSLVLFSEGIAIPTAVQRMFAAVIDAANRANVSIYTIDAAGLRAESEQGKIRDQVNATASGGGGILGGGAIGGTALTKTLENNEEVLRQDPRTGLGELASATGGQMFEGTNNLRPAFDRIEDDLHNYYLLGYTPTNEKFDGKFRTIDVKVKRPGVTVAARKGYFAVRNMGGTPVSPWEAAALGAMEQRPVPNAFPVRAAALLFPERGRPGLVPVVVDFRTAAITFQPAADRKTYTSDFTVLVRFLDATNQVARKVSQHYEINGPIDQVERARLGEVIFYREPELAPGVYSMETVVHDAASGKTSVRFATVEVPKIAEGALRTSSLVLVKRAEKVPEKDRRPDHPLLVNDAVLFPNVGEPVSRTSKEVGFFFTIYPRDGAPAPEAALELLLNGKLAARVPMTVPGADRSGRIQQVGRLPIEQLAPGTYELRAVVRQGTEQLVRSTMLRIVD